jgi:hypothetical protein
MLVAVIALIRVVPAAAAEGDRPLLGDAAAADRAGALLPTASVALGPAALLAQVGYAGVRKESMRYQSGLLAIGGLGLAF